MNVYEAILERASYRGAYERIAVPREDLTKIMKAGLAAPSGCNKQTVSLIAVDDPAVLGGLREVIGSAVGADAPAMICVLTRRLVAYGNTCFSAQDYGAAIENMLLEIVELGYQSCWVEGRITDAHGLGRKMADVLGVPKDYELICYLPVGRAKDAVKRVEKQPFEQRAWFNGFQKAD